MPENEFDIQEKETKQYISVKIGEEKFGIDIGYVDNIVRMQKITRVPKAQKYFKGIINLRGDIVPVMSARIKMGLDDDVYTSSTRIIILKLEEKGEHSSCKFRCFLYTYGSRKAYKKISFAMRRSDYGTNLCCN